MFIDCPECGLVEPEISPLRGTPFCPVCGKWLKFEDPFDDWPEENGDE